MCILLASVLGFPHLLTLFARVLSYTRVYLVAGRSLFLDIQVVTILLKEFTFWHEQISATPIPGHVHIFQQYLQHTYMSIHIRWNVREAYDSKEKKRSNLNHNLTSLKIRLSKL